MIIGSSFPHPAAHGHTVPMWALVIIGSALIIRLVVMACCRLIRADQQINDLTAVEGSPEARRTRDDIGPYIDDPRIHAVHGNLIVLADGQMIGRSASNRLWRRYLPPDGDLDTAPGRQWQYIATALHTVLGDAQPVTGRMVVHVRGGR